MIQPLLKYPDPKIRFVCGNLRSFDTHMDAYVADIIDTLRAAQLPMLSGMLMGIRENIIVEDHPTQPIVYINSRIIQHRDLRTATERSPYYEGISADVDRYEHISIVYDDVKGVSHSAQLEGERARMFQQHLDYAFGSTFVDRVDPATREAIAAHLDQGLVPDEKGGACPIVFVRDRIKHAAWYVMMAMGVSFPLAMVLPQWRWLLARIDQYAIGGVLILIVVYFLYGQAESRQYKQCTSCQIGNLIGVSVKMLSVLLVLSLGVFFWMGA